MRRIPGFPIFLEARNITVASESDEHSRVSQVPSLGEKLFTPARFSETPQLFRGEFQDDIAAIGPQLQA